MLEVALLDLPQFLARAGIQGNRVCVELIKEDLAVGVRHPPVDHVATGDGNHIRVLLWLILPLEGRTRLGQVQGVHDVGERGDQIHGVADHQRRPLMPAQNARRERPGHLQILDVVGRDLVQFAIAGEGVVLARRHPLVRIFLHLDQILRAEALVGEQQKCSQKEGKQERC